MNITRLNFAQTLPFVKKTIQNSHYLAFDLQMSGIQTEQLTTATIQDSMQKRYEKQKQSINKFIPIQFGLSAFQVFPNENKILAYPFNFYIFPFTQATDVMKFSFHAGTMNFLTKNKFNFNKLFYEGIPFANRQQMQLLQKKENISNFKQELRRLNQIKSPQSIAFIKLNMPVIREWIKTSQRLFTVDINFIKYQSYILLQESIEQQFFQQPLLFTYDHVQIVKRTKMTITKCNIAEKHKQATKLDCEIEPEKMFNQVFEEIINSKKPLIVHNGFLDFMHVYYRFVESLPDKWTTYKRNIHSLFPYIYDNKYFFANSPSLFHHLAHKNTGLQQCFTGMKELSNSEHRKFERKQIKKEPLKLQIDQDFKQYNLDNLQCHEAGFDSLMTGFSLLQGVNHLNNLNNTDSSLNLLANKQAFHEHYQLFRNRIPLGSIKIPFNLEENDEDIYVKDGNQPIYFRSILNQTVEQAKVRDYFSTKFGPVNFLWTGKDMTSFCIIFLSEDNKKSYEQHLNKNSRINNFCSESIDNNQFLILSSEQHLKSMKNYIKAEFLTEQQQ